MERKPTNRTTEKNLFLYTFFLGGFPLFFQTKIQSGDASVYHSKQNSKGNCLEILEPKRVDMNFQPVFEDLQKTMMEARRLVKHHARERDWKRDVLACQGGQFHVNNWKIQVNFWEITTNMAIQCFQGVT